MSLNVPPHSIEAEQSVLGGLLLDNAAWDRIADFCRQDDFYRYDHRIIFEHIGKLIAATRPADVITVYEALSTSRQGGRGRRPRLSERAGAEHAERGQYPPLCGNRARPRRAAPARSRSPTKFPPTPSIRKARKSGSCWTRPSRRCFRSPKTARAARRAFLEIGPLLTQVVERIDTLYHTANPSDVTGTPTGFVDLDRMTSGMQAAS